MPNKPDKSNSSKKKKGPPEPSTQAEGMRLNKYVAHCGIASRRAADELIKKGQVKVNNQKIFEPGYRVKPNDKVLFKDKPINPVEKLVYVLMNKPKGVITTVQDEKGRKTVLDIVRSKVSERVYPVGRLDRDTTGLLLLTNDGDLTQKLAHPKYEVLKGYIATLDKNLSASHLAKINEGLELEDGPAPVRAANYLQGKKKNEIGIELHIGRNRIVRRIFESLGYEVLKLDRVFYAGLTKKDLPRGWHRPLTQKEIIMLKHFV